MHIIAGPASCTFIYNLKRHSGQSDQASFCSIATPRISKCLPDTVSAHSQCDFALQITPVLSMLRDMQSQHRAMLNATETKSALSQPVHNLPATVHLTWAVKNRDELQLLDEELLMTAGYVTVFFSQTSLPLET